jgi:hypothetical protein
MQDELERDPLPHADRNQVLDAARRLRRSFQDADARLRADRLTVPPDELKQEVTAAFWALAAVIEQYERSGGITDRGIARGVQELVGPWLNRSRFFNRAFHKPHGHAGDYRLLEAIYDLEDDDCADPAEPGIVNCIDHVFSTLHSVRAVWERRRRFAQLLGREYARVSDGGGVLRILEVGTGGARSVLDFLASLPEARDLELTLIDPEPAALNYYEMRSLAAWHQQLTCIVAPVDHLPDVLPPGDFDVVLAAGVFDYLDDPDGRDVMAYLAWRTASDGVIAATNHHPGDPSRFAERWLLDWPVHCRDEEGLDFLFPNSIETELSLSQNGALTFALGRK